MQGTTESFVAAKIDQVHLDNVGVEQPTRPVVPVIKARELRQQGWNDAQIQTWVRNQQRRQISINNDAECKTSSPSLHRDDLDQGWTLIELTDGSMTLRGLLYLLKWLTCDKSTCASATRKSLLKIDVSRNPSLKSRGCVALLAFWRLGPCISLRSVFLEECGLGEDDASTVLTTLYQSVAGNPRAHYVSLFPGNHGLAAHRESVENWLCFALTANRKLSCG
jgi:hypothetical protein